MTKEHEVLLAGNTDLSNNEKALGDKLFFEGVLYDEIKQNAVKVGTHLSFLIHRGGQEISIHFREGLEELNKYKNRPIKVMKKFLENIEDDLGQLASMLEKDSLLINVEEIWGLCNLSARWGERHGFITKMWSMDVKKITKFEQSITGKPSVGKLALPQPLNLFFHRKDTFISEFLRQ